MKEPGCTLRREPVVRVHTGRRGETGEKRKTKKEPQDLFKSREKRLLMATAGTFPGTGRLWQDGDPRGRHFPR